MKTWKTAAITVAAVVVLAALAALIVIATGAYNVAATSPHLGLVERILWTTQDRSVEVRAGGIKPPPEALNAKPAEGYAGFEKNLCAMCHGAPGVEPNEIGKGLYPHPPDLSKATTDMSLAEVYWVIANGIKDTGMPAYRASQKEEDLWRIASFVKQLPGMSATDYRRLGSRG